MGRETTWFQIADVGGFEGEELSTIYWLFEESEFTERGWFHDNATLPSNKLTRSKNMVEIVSLI